MTTPQRRPTTALFASAPAETLEALTKRKDRLFVGCELVRGTGAYLALVSYEPDGPHDEREIEAARALSAHCDDPVYMVSFDEDDERITTCHAGAVVSDAEVDDYPDPDKLARELGLGRIFPPASPEPRSFMLVENASVEAVEAAIGPTLKRMGKVLRLEARGADVLGWLENKTLGEFPEVVSEKLNTRVVHTIDMPRSFAVFVTETGADVGLFEEPRTTFSEGFDRIDSILGETTREGILRAMGVDEARIEQAGAPASPT